MPTISNIPMNLTTNTIFDSTSNSRFQYVYSSQLYGTFFNIYAKFNFDVQNKILISAKFRIVNYKGVLNLGIKDVIYQGIESKDITEFGFSINKKNSEDSEGDILFNKNVLKVDCMSFEIVVQALNPNILSKEILFNESIKQYNNLYLEINRTVSEIESIYTNKAVFDSEFFYRDGLRSPMPLRRTYRDGGPIKKIKNEKSNSNNDKGTGGICPKGYSLILF